MRPAISNTKSRKLRSKDVGWVRNPLYGLRSIREQFDRIVEPAHRMFADAFERKIALHKIRERAGQQHRLTQLFCQRFEARGHVDGGADHGEVEPGLRTDIAVHDIADV